MIWVAWRQHRAGVLTALGVLVAVAAVMLMMRTSAASMLADRNEENCLVNQADCSFEAAVDVNNAHGMYLGLWPLLLYILPVVLGVVAGAPVFARELSQGTHMFSLTQSVSRKRWWAVKLSVTLVPIAVGVGLLGLFSSWALGPLLALTDGARMIPGSFEVQGLVMVGYLVFAFALASTVGLLTRNNVVPMVVTVGVYIAVAFSIVLLARPSYLPPETAEATTAADIKEFDARTPESSWDVGEVYVDKAGNRYDSYAAVCSPDFCVEDDIVSFAAEYQPNSRFWTFQGIETGVYLVLGAAALAVGARRLRALP